MNTQSRSPSSPSTEAGGALLEWLERACEDESVLPELREDILAIEEAARAEGRREAVREIRERLALADYYGPRIDAILDKVAGLNASESPPEPDEAAAMRWLAANDLYAVTHLHESADCIECVGFVDASESPPTRPRFCVSCEGQHDPMKHELARDASESGQPPEES